MNSSITTTPLNYNLPESVLDFPTTSKIKNERHSASFLLKKYLSESAIDSNKNFSHKNSETDQAIKFHHFYKNLTQKLQKGQSLSFSANEITKLSHNTSSSESASNLNLNQKN